MSSYRELESRSVTQHYFRQSPAIECVVKGKFSTRHHARYTATYRPLPAHRQNTKFIELSATCSRDSQAILAGLEIGREEPTPGPPYVQSKRNQQIDPSVLWVRMLLSWSVMQASCDIGKRSQGASGALESIHTSRSLLTHQCCRSRRSRHFERAPAEWQPTASGI